MGKMHWIYGENWLSIGCYASFKRLSTVFLLILSFQKKDWSMSVKHLKTWCLLPRNRAAERPYTILVCCAYMWVSLLECKDLSFCETKHCNFYNFITLTVWHFPINMKKSKFSAICRKNELKSILFYIAFIHLTWWIKDLAWWEQ